MKPWQLGIGLLAGGAAFAIAFTATRSAMAKPVGPKALPPAPKAPPNPLPIPASPPGDGDAAGAGATPSASGDAAGAGATPSASGGPASPAGSPIPATALPTFLSGVDGSFAYYVPAEPPKDRSDLFLPLNGPMAVGQTIGAVLAFTHAGPKGSGKTSLLVPIEVTIEKVEDVHVGDALATLITVRSSKTIASSAEDPELATLLPLPEGSSWKVSSFSLLGIPTKAWFDQFTYA